MEDLGIPCKRPLSEEEIENSKEKDAMLKQQYAKIRAKVK